MAAARYSVEGGDPVRVRCLTRRRKQTREGLELELSFALISGDHRPPVLSVGKAFLQSDGKTGKPIHILIQHGDLTDLEAAIVKLRTAHAAHIERTRHVEEE